MNNRIPYILIALLSFGSVSTIAQQQEEISTRPILVKEVLVSNMTYDSQGLSRIKSNGDDELKVLVYPNPASNQITVSSNKSIVKIRIIDLMGRVVKEQDVRFEVSDVVLDISDLDRGRYYVEITDPNDENNRMGIIVR